MNELPLPLRLLTEIDNCLLRARRKIQYEGQACDERLKPMQKAKAYKRPPYKVIREIGFGKKQSYDYIFPVFLSSFVGLFIKQTIVSERNS